MDDLCFRLMAINLVEVDNKQESTTAQHRKQISKAKKPKMGAFPRKF